jgi:hypothetical protein
MILPAISLQTNLATNNLDQIILIRIVIKINMIKYLITTLQTKIMVKNYIFIFLKLKCSYLINFLLF